MTIKERLHKLVDELSDVEAEDALHIIAARHRGPDESGTLESLALTDEEAQRFLEALDSPEPFKPGLRRLLERPSASHG